MSGHSKWANIKRKKELNDRERASQFTKLSRLITLAVHEGGGIGDPQNNAKLNLIVTKAKAINMPKVNIERAIERATSSEKTHIKEIIYEAFGQNGIVYLIQTTTDNQNRTFNEIRNLVEQHEGKLGNQGSVMYQFQKCGLVMIKRSLLDENGALELSEKVNAFDMEEDADMWYIYIPFEELGKVRERISADIEYEIEIDFKPQNKLSPSDSDREKAHTFIEALEQHDDVQSVFSNI